MSFSPIGGLYGIVDDSTDNPLELTRHIMDGGCRILQLRAKNIPARDFVELARQIVILCNDYKAIFIINDRVDVALLSGAHGVHLGQDDLPLEEARRLMGEDKLIGISTHNIDEALEAEKKGADYIGFGPLFGTKTKKDAQEEKGVAALKAVKAQITIPIVAIGGINENNINSAIKAGADGVAVISAIANAEDVREATSVIINIIAHCHEG